MSFGSPQDVREQVREAVNIVDLVGGYLELRRQGSGYVALCPWHDDSRPSLQVNPQRQTWKCWVCDLGGDIFSFVMQREGVSFREALEMLAERASIELGTPGRPESRDEKKRLYDAVGWAEMQFHNCLKQAPEADSARRYLADRGITSESIDRFQLGFAPNQWQWLLDRARSTPFSPSILEAAGMVARSEQRTYDRFRGRVIFSIRDTQQRPIAFGGRILPELADDKSAKYINSPETRLFSKSNELYALHLARDSQPLKRPAPETPREVVVVEGYTDVVMAHQCDVQNVVAVLGTALGPRHIQVLRRFADRVTLVLDGDEAGQRRTNEVLELFVAADVDLRIVSLPEQMDPCDYLAQRGGPAFNELVQQQAVDALEHRVRTATAGIDLLQDTHRANQALDSILETIAKAPRWQTSSKQAGQIREQQFLSRLAREFRITEDHLRDRVRDLRRRAKTPVSASTVKIERTASARQLLPREQELLEILIQHSDLIGYAVQHIATNEMTAGPARDIYDTIKARCAKELSLEFSSLLTDVEDPGLKNILVDLDERARRKSAHALEFPQDRLEDLSRQFAFDARSRQQRVSERALEDPSQADDTILQALEDSIQLERDRQGISAPTDG